MAKELYDGIYSTHRLIFIEKVQSNIETFLKDKIERTYKVGLEVLCILEKENLGPVFKELTENPEFGVNILNNLTKFDNRYGSYLLASVSSSTNNFSLLLKVRLGEKGTGDQFEELVRVLEEFFESAKKYRTSKRQLSEISDHSDLVIYNQMLEGLDCYDIYLQADTDIIEDVFVSDEISRSITQDFYKDLDIINVISKMDTFDWKAGIFPELCFCMNLEELLQIKIPRRVQYIRVLLSELFRIASHLSCLLNTAKLLEYDFAYDLLILERERTLRLIEHLTGSRVFPNFIRVGGLKNDLKAEMEDKIKKGLPDIYRNILKAQTHFFGNSIILKRLRDKGFLDFETALKNGVTGPNLRASGMRFDMRKNRNLLNYKDISFIIPTGKYGDCLDRVVIRFQEILQSLKIINQVIKQIPDEHYKTIGKNPNFDFKYSSMVSSVECPHGAFKLYLEIEDNDILTLVVMGPSRNTLFNLGNVLKGESIEDMNLILSTLDISPGELLHW